jgi:F-type H+-transporting ATPase subunit epsilon
MAGALHLSITTPEELVFDGEASSVVVPAADGELGVLPRHAPLIGSLGEGELRVAQAAGGTSRYFVEGGFLQVLENKVTVLAVKAQPLASIDPAAEEAELRRLVDSPPGREAGIEARDEHARRVGVVRKRVRAARRGRE